MVSPPHAYRYVLSIHHCVIHRHSRVYDLRTLICINSRQYTFKLLVYVENARYMIIHLSFNLKSLAKLIIVRLTNNLQYTYLITILLKNF